eukprot:CAMPEP_0170629710 /NCGR_PEP_ID=MMETSP0224-20130122/33517_1 /TAXON_ID=285029 /ORGANISM="Togula jolla, Strain CCCM 725" /LENGTH=289 /DNA_ID=CAMNT_0010957529 /DNA_START=58 /DNA_END=924 /DNA_ORIENTATION=+
MTATRVKNTFIDVSTTPSATPLPSPLATAPAHQHHGFSLKESLTQAAAVPENSVMKARLKPQPLGQNIMPILENSNAVAMQPNMERRASDGQTPMCGATFSNTTPSSMPSTPYSTWGCSTPTGTPTYFAQTPTYFGQTTQVGPEPNPTRLSLVDMIQSPKAEVKQYIMQSAQRYQTWQPFASAPIASRTCAGPAATQTLGLIAAPPPQGPPVYAGGPQQNGYAPSVYYSAPRPGGPAPMTFPGRQVPPPPAAPAPSIVMSPAGAAAPQMMQARRVDQNPPEGHAQVFGS